MEVTACHPSGTSTPGGSEGVQYRDSRTPGLLEIILQIPEHFCNESHEVVKLLPTRSLALTDTLHSFVVI